MDATAAQPTPARADRIASLDQFRGYTVVGMLLVNFLGGYKAVPALLKHHNTYCSYADTIMPQFLFAVGFVSFPSIAHAAVAPLLFVGLTTIEGHFVTPNIIGRRLTLKPLAVLAMPTIRTFGRSTSASVLMPEAPVTR